MCLTLCFPGLQYRHNARWIAGVGPTSSIHTASAARRAAVLAPRERVNAKKAKHAARLVARQLAGGLEHWREDLTTDAAEACVFGAWACTELGWRDDAIVERFSNGDLRVVAKRPIDVE